MNGKTIIGAAMVLVVCLAAVGCAPQKIQQGTVEGVSGVEPATVAQWSPEADCAPCHSVQAASMTDSACLASKHAEVACITCHDDVEALAVVHDGAESPSEAKKLNSTTLDETVCLSCHGSWESLAAETQDTTALTDYNGTVVNPHEVLTVHNDVTCTSCHGMHAAENLDEAAGKACAKCHHTGVYECYTCHE